jgi:cytochrome c biogenesis protein CcmG, thiol:disulfide interchange protein DsbE
MPQAPDVPPDKPRSRSLFLIPVILFGALSLLFLVQLFTGDPARVPSALIGRPVPSMDLPALESLNRDGGPIPGFGKADLSSGRISVINVFASWCAPCRTEHPLLMEMAASDLARSGRLAIIGLNYKDEPENARRFLGVLGNPYTRVGTDRAGRSAIEWGVYGVPETFLVSADGTILNKIVGPLDAARTATLMADIRKRLN